MSYHSFGKVLFTTITSNNPEYSWNYSCDDFEQALSVLLTDKTLKKVFVGLDGYLEGAKREENYYDFSYMGGTVLMVFSENVALELDVRAEGMIAHRFHKVSDLTFRTTKDYPPNDMVLSEAYYFDIKDEFALSFEDTRITMVKVDGTNTYAFSAKGFDEEKATLAMYQNKLPANVHFVLDNNVKISLFGDAIEYFNLYLEQV